MMKITRFYSLLILLLLCSLCFSSCSTPIPVPEIKSGEFNFSVTYEYGGEIRTLSGVYVCEFDGIDWVLDGGFCREWSGYIKGNTLEEHITLGTAEDGGVVELDLIFDPERFMGDYYMEEDEAFLPLISVTLFNEGLYFETDETVIAETYGARIISYDYDEPIENTFN